jgi:hypothetical protein
MELLGGSLSRLWCVGVSVHHPLHCPILTWVPVYLSQSQLNSTQLNRQNRTDRGGLGERAGKTQKAARHRGGGEHAYLHRPAGKRHKKATQHQHIGLQRRHKKASGERARTRREKSKEQRSISISDCKDNKKASGERARTRQEKSKRDMPRPEDRETLSSRSIVDRHLDLTAESCFYCFYGV